MSQTAWSWLTYTLKELVENQNDEKATKADNEMR